MAIDVGSPAVWVGTEGGLEETHVGLANPANGSGYLRVVEIYLHDATTPIVGTFFGTPPNLACRDFANIGPCSAGYNKVTGLSIEVQAGDYIGVTSESLAEEDNSIAIAGMIGSGVCHKAGNQMETGQQEYTQEAAFYMSLCGTGGATLSAESSITVSTQLVAGGSSLCLGAVAVCPSASLAADAWPIRSGTMFAEAVASVEASATRILPPGYAEITIQAAAMLHALGGVVRFGQVDVNAACSVTADSIWRVYGDVGIAAAAALTAVPIVVYDGAVTITATTSLHLAALAYITQQLGYTGTLTAGDRLVIDTDAMTVKLNGSNVRANFTGKFWKLWRGSNELKWASTGDTPNATLEVNHEPRWM